MRNGHPLTDSPQQDDRKANASGADPSSTSAAIDAGSGSVLQQLQERLVYLERRIAQHESEVNEHSGEDSNAPKGPSLGDLHRQAQALHSAVAERERKLQEQTQLITKLKEEREQVVKAFKQFRTQAETLKRVHLQKQETLQEVTEERDKLTQERVHAQQQLDQMRHRLGSLEQQLQEAGVQAGVGGEGGTLPESMFDSSSQWAGVDADERSALHDPELMGSKPLPAFLTRRRPRLPIVFAALIGIVVAVANVKTWTTPTPTYVIGGLTGDDPEQLEQWASTAPELWQVNLHSQQLELVQATLEPELARAELENWLASLMPEPEPTTAPAEQEVARARLREMVAEHEGQLQSEMQTLERQIHSLDELRRRRRETRDTLRQVRTELDQLREPADVNPNTLTVPESAIREAEQRDRRLQADLLAWNRQAERARGHVVTGMKAETSALETLAEAASQSLAALGATLESEVAEVAREDVEAVHRHVESWAMRSNDFLASWIEKVEVLGSAAPGEIPELLGKPWFERLRQFEREGADLASKIEARIEVIGRSGENPTQRLVLRNRLVEEARPLQAAWKSAARAIRQSTPDGDRVMAGLLDTVHGLLPRIEQRREAMMEELRERELDRQIMLVHRERMEVRAKREELLAEQGRLLDELTELGDQLAEADLALSHLSSALGSKGKRLVDTLRDHPALNEPAEEPEEDAPFDDVRIQPIQISSHAPNQPPDAWPQILLGINVGGSVLIILLMIGYGASRPS